MLCRTLRKECTCQQQADAGDTYGPHCADVLLVCRRMGYGTVLQAHATDSRGRSVTTYHHRPTVVAIVDPFNKYIIGYAIGRHESATLIRQAFRNAFEHVKELFGSYFKPWQVQTDNYGRGHLKCFYEAVGHWYTPAAVKNAKSKIIEPFFNQFNRQWLRLLPNSSGHGVKSRQKLQVSDDWIETHKRDFPISKDAASSW